MNTLRITRLDTMNADAVVWACPGNGAGLGSLWEFNRWKWDPDCSETSVIGAAWHIDRQS